ncbi:hypothetical protein B0A55_10204 [Friedmanniomyces simplex]|uniref:Glycosyltransferase 2-like domain-containing protein n=1 Tax=Friedmanniomyces simplex TaxID=329884 RepID=A0A4U0WKW4_9PEZI|nr:hypothetical protein B0A55_10204 [Friedmanniomyces simplex]
MLAYFGFRLYTLIYAQAYVYHGGKLGLAWVFLLLEIATLLTNGLPYGLRALAWHRPNRPHLRLEGDDVPTVDVLITSCGEDIDVILDTVLAACSTDCPVDRFRIFLCDDGRSEEVCNRISAPREKYPNVYYVSRPKPEIPDYKAGNLNNGLHHSRALPRIQAPSPQPPARVYSAKLARNDTPSSSESTSVSGDEIKEKELDHEWNSSAEVPGHEPSEFVAGLDADMTFYDTPTNDPLTQNMLQFAGLTESVNDSLGHADCLGSGYVMRRVTVEAIGGFPIESLSEDVCCSAKLLGAGWKTVFVQEFLQYGSVPASYYAHVKQRTRWSIGHIQTALLFRFRTSSKFAKHLDLRQKLTGITFDLRQFMQIPTAFNYAFIPLSLYAGYPLVIWNTEFQLSIMGWVAAIGNGEYDVRISSYDSELEQWLGPYILNSFVRPFILPKRFGGQAAGFKSTGSIADNLAERDRNNRASVWRRMYDILWHQRGLFHVIFKFVCLGGVALTCVRPVHPDIPSAYTLSQRTYGNQMIYLITRIGWPPAVWLQFLHASLVPPLYALFPPRVPPRDEVLIADPKTSIKYPRPEVMRLKRSA